MLTKDERAAMRARCEAASEGAWMRDDDRIYAGVRLIAWLCDDSQEYEEAADRAANCEQVIADGAFLVNARTDLPAALDALDAAEQRVADLEAENARLIEQVVDADIWHAESVERVADLEAALGTFVTWYERGDSFSSPDWRLARRVLGNHPKYPPPPTPTPVRGEGLRVGIGEEGVE
jgi:hypothetical protein